MTDATLNVTFEGQSQDLLKLPFDTSDDDVRRVAAEAMSLHLGTFDLFVVDRFDGETPRLYLRPKVPFG